MKFMHIAGALAALAVSFGAASAANAVTYNLTNVGDQTQFAPGTLLGTVDVTSPVAGQLNYTVTLLQGLKFVDTGAHNAFSFALVGAPALTLTAPSGFTLISGANSVGNPPFGGFDYGLACGSPACGAGGSNPYNGPLTFSVTGTGLSLASIDSGNGGILFAVDTIAPSPCGRESCTGAIGGGVLAVPETATWGMMILGLGMVGFGLRMRRRTAALAA